MTENKISITVFTPTYNRAYKLPVLYKSLCIQTMKNFEWLIVDDGSSDDTENLINNFIQENKIIIRYYKQKNSGKHIAINKGLDLAKGELFFIVDSDDWLYGNALERIVFHHNAIKFDNNYCGVCGLRTYPDGERIGGEKDFGILDCNSLDFRYKYHIKGDVAEAFKTDVLRQYKFPENKNEKFCPEALIWNRLAKKYILRFFYEKIYFCEYLPDGLTAKITKLRKENPENSCTYYSELKKANNPFFQKIKAAINYWRFAFYLKQPIKKKLKQIGYGSILIFPLSYLFFLRDKKA